MLTFEFAQIAVRADDEASDALGQQEDRPSTPGPGGRGAQPEPAPGCDLPEHSRYGAVEGSPLTQLRHILRMVR
jgi:hypothetical protein